jgi:hypothetical protein
MREFHWKSVGTIEIILVFTSYRPKHILIIRINRRIWRNKKVTTMSFEQVKQYFVDAGYGDDVIALEEAHE